MEQDLEMSMNTFFNAWVRGNKFIRKSVASYSALFSANFKQSNLVTVNLNEFAEDYQKKFLDNSLEVYSESLLKKLQPDMLYFRRSQQLDSLTINWYINYKEHLYRKTITY
jgi:hypothetical protein